MFVVRDREKKNGCSWLQNKHKTPHGFSCYKSKIAKEPQLGVVALSVYWVNTRETGECSGSLHLS